MVQIDTLSRQPTELDYADPTKFRFSIKKLPIVEFFTTAANLPGINLGEAIFPTPFKQIPIMGDDLTYENLEITFLVDEKLSNYIEVHNWMVGIGFPQSRTQYGNLRTEGDQISPSQGKEAGQESISGMFSDATLTITSAKNNPIIEARFQDMYPVALTGLAYNQQEGDITYLTANVTFTYKIYTLHTL
tara:strand:+ start:689 stop:1255 length:567 start_codon:yes stop_codon:yes gene_type:complete